MKTYIIEKPFKLLGYTLDEYLRWCEKHNLKPYETESKRIFFKRCTVTRRLFAAFAISSFPNKFSKSCSLEIPLSE